MKLLFFASDYIIGLSSLLTEEAIAFKKNDIDLTCIAGEKEQELGLSQRIKKAEIEIIRINGLDEHQDFRKRSREIADIIIAHNISIVHVQNNWQLMLLAYCRLFFRKTRHIKLIYTLHGFRHNHPVKSFLATIVIGLLLLLFADKVQIMSKYVWRRFFFLSHKRVLLYLGIDNSFFTNKENTIHTDSMKIVFPAQFRHGKNQDMLIKAIAMYCSKTQDTSIRLYLPGTGPLLDPYKQLAVDSHVQEQVVFPGLLSKKEIKELYLKCNIAAIPSNSETFGQSIVEPFVLGRMVLARKVGVAPEIIVEDENGYFFSDENDLCERLLMIRDNMDCIAKAGNENFQKRNLFHWDYIADHYKSVISSLV